MAAIEARIKRERGGVVSLDVWLKGSATEVECSCPHCDHEHTRIIHEEFYSGNITHNLNKMADAAGIYQALWRPEELGITQAKDLVPIIEEGLSKLKADPEHYKQFNASNGWGMYEHFVPFVEEYLEACKEHPEATVKVWR